MINLKQKISKKHVNDIVNTKTYNDKGDVVAIGWLELVSVTAKKGKTVTIKQN